MFRVYPEEIADGLLGEQIAAKHFAAFMVTRGIGC